MELVYSMLALTLVFSTPIIITSLGGMFSERSGIVNIGLEGLMMFGGFTAATALVFLQPYTDLAPWIAILLGALVGGVVSLIHAYLSIHAKADQIISGVAINMLATGVTIYLAQVIFEQQRTASFSQSFQRYTFYGLSDIPFIGDVLFTRVYLTVHLAIILVVASWFVLYKTPFGLRLRAAGEHPHALDSMGVSVFKMRYIGVVISGALAGLGGGILVLTQDIQYTVMSIGGTGFIALAALIFGRWKPAGVLGAGLFFGFSRIFALYSSRFDLLAQLPNEVFFALPYVLTIIALVAFSRQSVAPKAVGKPYDKGGR
ncbi:ABC transporter permease [Isachenkonia alkalipeptolytica]|uniref:ABC transporter permease n=1 Tax=Isachenkonia alkalipeptolytica TaxID=2565777 RepID=A0AA44BFR3_9CLOT|nr:ABC transporter permease [Isachenkonia alkalipeptolytica]NBG89190.1 ABC transporter permease [Isachenkonia alkalipeptolytica]